MKIGRKLFAIAGALAVITLSSTTILPPEGDPDHIAELHEKLLEDNPGSKFKRSDDR